MESIYQCIDQILTSFCAENIEFMRGIYELETSGDTDKISIRGSRGIMEGVSVFEDIVAGLTSRLISGPILSATTAELGT